MYNRSCVSPVRQATAFFYQPFLVLSLVVSLAILFSCQRGPDEELEYSPNEETIITDVELRIDARQSDRVTQEIFKCGDQTASPDSLGRIFFSKTKVNRAYATVKRYLASSDSWVYVRGFVPQEGHNFLTCDYYFDGRSPDDLGIPFNSAEDLLVTDWTNSGEFMLPANSLERQDGSSFSGTAYYNLERTGGGNGLAMFSGFVDFPPYARDKNKKIHLIHEFGGKIAIVITDDRNVPLKLKRGSKMRVFTERNLTQEPPSPLRMYGLEQQTGLWKEISDDAATGNNGIEYTTEVSELGIMVFGLPHETVLFRARLVDAQGGPVYSPVVISSASNREVFSVEQTNIDGWVNAYVPKGVDLNLDVVPMSRTTYLGIGADWHIVSRTAIAPLFVDTELPSISISNQSTDMVRHGLFRISGQVFNCNGQPVANAQVIETDLWTRAMPTVWTDAEGRFDFSTSRGNLDHYKGWNFIVFDGSTGYVTSPIKPHMIDRDPTVLSAEFPELTVCNQDKSEYFRVTMENGTVLNYQPPQQQLSYSLGAFHPTEEINVDGSVVLAFEGNMGAGARALWSFQILSLGLLPAAPAPPVIVTENWNNGSLYTAGEVKQFTVKDASNVIHTVDIAFRVKH